jgi:hypothetical protein
MRTRNLGRKEILIRPLFVFLLRLTAASIFVIYGRTYFAKWPWLQASITLSLLTCLWPFALRGRKNPEIVESVVYGLGSICVEIFLVYPGARRLELAADPRLFVLIFTLGMIHGLALNLIWRWKDADTVPGRNAVDGKGFLRF